jgi:hypothetical protein
MHINKVFNILSCLTIVLFTVGCSAQQSFDELTKDIPANLKVRRYSSAKMNYNISMPKRFELLDRDYYDTLSIELFADTTILYEEGTNILSILKYNSSMPETTIEEAWKKLLTNRQLIEDFRIFSEGVTDFLSVPAYYEHSACTISEKNTESISFLFRGNSSDFYVISISVNTEEGYPTNMRELLYCAKSIVFSNIK